MKPKKRIKRYIWYIYIFVHIHYKYVRERDLDRKSKRQKGHTQGKIHSVEDRIMENKQNKTQRQRDGTYKRKSGTGKTEWEVVI